MKKTWLVRTILAALLSCGMVFALASCSTNYTVSYSLGEHAADGAAAPESAEYAQGTQITLPEAPAAEDGWEFTAWSDGETTYDAGDSFTVEANVTFTAQWTEVTTPEPETYTVTFAVGANAADGATAPAAVQVEDGESVTLPAGDDIPAAATGYHFDGWYVEGTKIEGTTYTPAADVTITATYAANIYTVAFDDNVDDSSVMGTMASQPFTYGTAQNLTDNAFTRTGYTFSGWATSADGTVAYNDEESVNNLTAKNGATVTLYAVWDPIAPTIKWEKTDNVTGNDPSGTIYSWNEESGNYTITLPENTYSCAGSVFNGWVVVVNESSNSYQPGEKFTVAPGTEITISPGWKVTSTITFDPNGATGGTVPDAITGKVSGDTIDLPGNTGNLVRTGYTFVGWSETQDGNAIEGQYTVEGNVTLYAVWTANTYTVTLDYNYENAPADVTITVTFGSTFGAGDGWPTADPVRDGFTFKGWWTANDGTGTQYTGATQVTTEAANLTLYAHWSATAVSVTFDYNDGTDSTEHDQIVPVEVNGTITAEDVNDPTREGYRFEGWFTAADGGTKVEFPIGNVTEPATYYAHWTQVWTVSVDGATVATLAEGKTYELGTPDARDGFTFMGWAVDGEIAYTTTDNTVTMGTENIVLTTVWADHSKISTEAELLAVLADATADTIKLADNIDMTTSGIDIRRDFSINLNEKTITFTTSATAAAADRIRLTAYGTSYSDRIEVAITNGALGFNTNANPNIDGSASMIFTQNVDLTMDGVAVTSDAMGLFIACGKLNMTNCTVTAVGAYAIGTNASISEGSELYGPVDMTISGSTLTAEFNGGAGLLFNVAGSLTLTNTSVTGGRQGVIIRSGTATITGGSITSAWTDPDTDSYIDSWGSGTAVPMAALVIGDISANAYKNNTSVTISGTQVIVKGDPVPSAARYIYIAGDATDGTTATLTYACDDTYMPALADTNGIIVANNSASVVVKHSETLTYVEEQEATCTEDGHAAYYQCSICEKYFDAEHNETTLEELKTADKLGHEYNALVYDSKTGVVSISCARNDLTISATVTISGGDATGTLVLAAENFEFNQDTQMFTLTLPANAYDAPTGKYFGGWLVAVANDGDEVYQPDAMVTIENAATITITAHWADLAVERTSTNASIGTWGLALPANYTLYEGQKIVVSTEYAKLGTQASVWSGLVVQIKFADNSDSWFFRPDRYACYLGAWGTQTNMSCNDAAIPEDFNALRLRGRTEIEVSLSNDTIVVTEMFYDIDAETPTYSFTWTVTDATASQYAIYFANDNGRGDPVVHDPEVSTLENVTMTVGVVLSENQNPTTENPIVFGNSTEFAYTGLDPVWTGAAIHKGEKVTMTGTLRSAANNEFETLIINLFSTGRYTSFRMDNWLAGELGMEGWSGEMLSSVNVDTEKEAFCAIIQDCSITVTIDWSVESQILVSVNYVSNTSEASKLVEFKLTPLESAFAYDSYLIGLGCEDCLVTINSIDRS